METLWIPWIVYDTIDAVDAVYDTVDAVDTTILRCYDTAIIQFYNFYIITIGLAVP